MSNEKDIEQLKKLANEGNQLARMKLDEILAEKKEKTKPGWDDPDAEFKPFREKLDAGDLAVIYVNFDEPLEKKPVDIKKKYGFEITDYYFLKEIEFLRLCKANGEDRMEIQEKLVWQFRKSVYQKLKPLYLSNSGWKEIMVYCNGQRDYKVRILKEEEIDECMNLPKNELVAKYFSGHGVNRAWRTHS